ncbi:transcriptional regulator [Malassezia cuniculi]|uniref:Transcriptional regulator n=1 Tax=Malassezia cuniculi TaxID=948313 RepID=A0AAF0EWP7_9BASI|nr:transcriptional regulator [Malassezia cuniculi]
MNAGRSTAYPSQQLSSNSAGFDLADFPALGSQASHAGSASGSNSMFHSYASQAGTGVQGSSLGSGMDMVSRGAAFTNEDFPALNRAIDNRQAHAVRNVHPMGSSVPETRQSAWQAERHQESGWAPVFGGQVPMNQMAAAAAARPSEDATKESIDERQVYGDAAQLPISQVLASPADRFGLVGLVSLIKMQDPDMSMLTMGKNLQTLGMNLAVYEPLSSSFVTPWSQDPAAAAAQVEPAFHLPSCYNVQPPPPAQSKITSFSDETLFFVFYSTPRDVLQEVAAQELYARNWRYHKGLHLWLTKEQNTEPIQKTPTYERGTYVFFDPGSWEKVSKSFVLISHRQV